MALKMALFLLLLPLLGVPSSGSESLAKPNLKVMDVPAFGRVAQLGEFYDATTERFQNQMIFRGRLPPDRITSLASPSTITKFQVVESVTEKVTFLGIAASLAVSLKCATFNVDVKGSASFVKDEKQSASHVEGILVHKTQTSRESINLFHKGIRPYVDEQLLPQTTASHVVTGIYYGADVGVRVTDTNVYKRDLQEIKGKLEISFSVSETFKIEAMAEVNITNKDVKSLSTYDLQVSGDLPMNILPTNSYEVREFIKTIPELLSNINGGKGKPIRYILTPVKLLEKAYDLEIKNGKIVNTIDSAILQSILFTFDAISKTRQKLNDLQTRFGNYVAKSLPPPVKKTLDILRNSFELRAGEFTVDIRKGLVKAKGNSSAVGELQDILTSYSLDPEFPANVDVTLEHDFEDGKRKIQFYESFLKHDVEYLNEASYESSLINTKNLIVYTLFYNLSLIEADASAWKAGTHIFFGQLKRSGTGLKVVDCDFPLGYHSHCTRLRKTEIHSFIDNKRVSSDVVSDFFPLTRSEPFRLPAFSHSNFTSPQAIYDLGQLYDRKHRSFLQEFIIKREENSSVLTQSAFKPLPKLECEIIPPDYKSMFLALHLHPMFHVPLILKKVALQGSGQILSFPKNESMDRLNLVCEQKSESSFVQVHHTHIMKALDLVSLTERTEATYFVQSTEFTGTTVISMETVKGERSTEELRRKLHRLKVLLKTGATKDPEFDNELTRFQISIYSDILPKNRLHPSTGEEALEILREIETTFEKDTTRGTKVYNLYPISNLQLDHGMISKREKEPSIFFKGLLEFPLLFETLALLQFKVRNETDFLKKNEESTPKDKRTAIAKLQPEFEQKVHGWVSRLKRVYQDFHSAGNTTGLEKALEDGKKVIAKGEATWKALKAWTERLTEARNFHKAAKASSYTYITSEREWRQAFYDSSAKRVYFLFYQFVWMSRFQDIWVENLSTFFSKFKDDSIRTYIVDCSFFTGSSVCGNVSRPLIQEYMNGTLQSADVMDKLRNEGKAAGERQEQLKAKLKRHEREEKGMLDGIDKKLADTAMERERIKASFNTTLNSLRENIIRDAGAPPPPGYVYIQYGTEGGRKEKSPEHLWKKTSKDWVGIYSTNYHGWLWEYGYCETEGQKGLLGFSLKIKKVCYENRG